MQMQRVLIAQQWDFQLLKPAKADSTRLINMVPFTTKSEQLLMIGTNLPDRFLISQKLTKL